MPFVCATDGVELRAVLSRDPTKVHADIPDVDVVPDVAALLARRDIDLVVVFSPDALHADHALHFAVHGTRGSWIKYGLDTQEPAILAGAGPGDPELGVGCYTAADDVGATSSIPNERGAYTDFWRALAAAIAGEGPNPVPTAEAIEVIELLEADAPSSAEGRTVALETPASSR